MRGAYVLMVMAIVPAAPAAPAEVGFTVKVVLAPKAAARLAAVKHGIQIVAHYGGDPLPKWKDSIDQDSGDIDLGADILVMPGSGSLSITGKALKRERLLWIKPGTFHVTVSVNPDSPMFGAYSVFCYAPYYENSQFDYGIYKISKINGRVLVFKCK